MQLVDNYRGISPQIVCAHMHLAVTHKIIAISSTGSSYHGRHTLCYVVSLHYGSLTFV